MEWETEATTSPEALFDVHDSASVKTDFVRTLERRLVTDGERWLSVQNGQRWDNLAQRFITTRTASSQSIDGYTVLYDRRDGEEFDTAQIYKQEKGSIRTSSPDMSAYFLLMSPFHPRHGQLCERRYEFPERISEEFCGDQACAVLSFKHRTDGFFAKVYLAANLNWLPVRFEIGKRVDVEFRYGADQSPLPTGWTIRVLSPDLKSVEDKKVASVTKWESPSEIPDKEFAIDFPPGTVVWDYRSFEHINYQILADGSHRTITEKEPARKVSVPILKKSQRDEAIPSESRTANEIALVIAVNLIVIALLLVIFRRTRSKVT
ncbi:MAG: hypothetical protein U0941_25600 [Planctomycetaceae bacterium]